VHNAANEACNTHTLIPADGAGCKQHLSLSGRDRVVRCAPCTRCSHCRPAHALSLQSVPIQYTNLAHCTPHQQPAAGNRATAPWGATEFLLPVNVRLHLHKAGLSANTRTCAPWTALANKNASSSHLIRDSKSTQHTASPLKSDIPARSSPISSCKESCWTLSRPLTPSQLPRKHTNSQRDDWMQWAHNRAAASAAPPGATISAGTLVVTLQPSL
jgi:hypothetical protein